MMRHTIALMAAAAFAAVIFIGAGPAKAAPLPKIDNAQAHNSAVEPVGYYRRRSYRSYRYARPYRYYAPRYNYSRYYCPRSYGRYYY